MYGVAEEIKRTAHWEVNVEVDLFHAKSGANRLVSGLFKGKTLIYSDLKHVVVRVSPKYMVEAEENAILVSSHIDTVFSTYVPAVYHPFLLKNPFLFIFLHRQISAYLLFFVKNFQHSFTTCAILVISVLIIWLVLLKK